MVQPIPTAFIPAPKHCSTHTIWHSDFNFDQLEKAEMFHTVWTTIAPRYFAVQLSQTCSFEVFQSKSGYDTHLAH